MEFFEVLKARRSIRVFDTKPIEQDKIKTILKAIQSAPTAGNLQAYQVALVDDERIKAKIASAAYGQDFIAKAPIVLVFFGDPTQNAWRYGDRGKKLYAPQDATIACCFAHLAASAVGLGSVWVGAFNDKQVSEAVDAPSELQPVAILPIGYPAEDPPPTSRRPITQFVRKNRF